MALEEDDVLQPLPLPPVMARPTGALTPKLPWTMRLVDGFMQGLPVVVMALLAVATTWLVRQAPSSTPDPVAAPARHLPDYEMKDFALQRHPVDGAPPSVIQGQAARHYPDTDTLEIDRVNVRWVDDQGQVTLIRAARATLQDDRSHAVLEGDAVVTRLPLRNGEASMTFRGQRLYFDNEAQRVRSDRPVQVDQGGQTLTADGLLYDHRTGELSLSGNVRGVLPSQPRR